MSNSVRLTLYTQVNCVFCEIMKAKLDDWGYSYNVINVSEDISGREWLRSNNHRTVPQLYWNTKHLNKVNTQELTEEILEAELNFDDYVGGVENFQ
jgi:glutaredoxin